MPRSGIPSALLAATLLAGVAADAAAQVMTRAYVANRGASTVTVVDVATAAVRKTIALEAPPHDVVVAHGRVFVSMPSVNRLAVIDPVRLTVVGAVDVPGGPRDLDVREQTLNDERLYISTDDGLRRYDPQTQTLAAAIAVGPGQQRAIEAGNASFNQFADQAFVAACDGGAAVRAVTVSSGVVSAPVATGAAPCAVLVTSSAIYVANRDDDTVTIFGPGFASPVTVPVADMPIGLVDTPFGVAVASANGTVSFISSSTNTVTGTLAVGGTPTAITTTLEPGFQVVTLVVTDASGSLRMVLASGAFPRTAPTGALPGAVAVGDVNPSDPIGLSSAGVWADAPLDEVAMSGDGRFVAFTSAATSLVAADGNALPDVFVRDRLLQRTARVSVTSSGAEATGGGVVGQRSGSYAPLLSADGRFVLFQSLTTNLVAGDTNGREDLFLHDRDLDGDGLFDEPGQIETRRVSVQSDGTDATCRVGSPTACAAPHIEAALSSDGRHVVFSSVLEFDAADVNGLSDVFAIDVARSRTTRMSQRPGGLPGAGVARTPVVSAGGRIVAFRTSDLSLIHI